MMGLGAISADAIAGLPPGATAARDGAVPADQTGAPPMTDIHDIKPILDISGNGAWEWVLPGCAAALLLFALGWWLWKRRQRSERPAEDKAPPEAPDQEALAALDALTAETGLAPKQFYFRLSAILRRYVERRYQFPAAEMTTEELIPHMDRLELDRDLATAFKAFCRGADPIKFAGATALRDRADRDLVFCRDFVRRTTTMEIEQDSSI
jgi:hypothetical protein